MVYSAIVMFCALGFAYCPAQISDEKGPYKTPLECYTRGGEIIYSLAQKGPVTAAVVLCIHVKEKKKRNILFSN